MEKENIFFAEEKILLRRKPDKEEKKNIWTRKICFFVEEVEEKDKMKIF